MAQTASKTRVWAEYPGTRRYTDADLEEVSPVDTTIEDEPIAILAEDVAFTLRGSYGERQSGMRVRYLTQYAGKNILESSWEPAHVFKNGGEFLIDQWHTEKGKQERGESPRFDVEDFERRSKPLRDAALERKRKRGEKRSIQRWLEQHATTLERSPNISMSRQNISDTASVKSTEPKSQNSLFDGDLPGLSEDADTAMDTLPGDCAVEAPPTQAPKEMPFAEDSSNSHDSDDKPLIQRRRRAPFTKVTTAEHPPADSPEPGEILSSGPPSPTKRPIPLSLSPKANVWRTLSRPKVLIPSPRRDVETFVETSNAPTSPKSTQKWNTDIFKNWNAQKQKRRSWLTNPSSAPQAYSTLQQRTWVKQSNEKHAPVPPPPDQVPVSPMNMRSVQPEIDRIAQQTLKPVTKTTTEIVTPVVPTHPKPIPKPTQPEAENEDAGELLTCWFWANERPCYPECVFEHVQGFKVAPEGNDLRDCQEYACCPHYSSRSCYRTADACWFAHAPRKYVGPSHRFGRFERSKWHPIEKVKAWQNATRPSPLSWEALGCFYFNTQGGCHKSEGECRFAHRYTRYVAPRRKDGDLIYQADGGVYAKGSLEEFNPAEELPKFSRPDDIDEGVHMEVDDELDPASVQALDVTASLQVTSHGQRPMTSISCRLQFDNQAAYKRFSDLLAGAPLQLRCQSACRIEDAVSWTKLCPESKRLKGQLHLDSRAVVDTLRMHDMAAVCLIHEQPMFISPCLNTRQGQSDMEFCYCDTKLETPDYSGPVTSGFGRYDFDRLLNREHKSKLAQVMAVLDPTGNQGQAEKLLQYLQGHAVHVYTNTTLGAWEYFCKNVQDGTILFQSDFNEWSQVRGLNKLLSMNTRFFHLGSGLTEDWVNQPLTRIFPNGLGVLITDDCLTDYAEETLPAIIQLARRSHLPGARCFVITRPGFQTWLSGLITARRDAGDDASALCKIRDHLWDMRAIGGASEFDGSESVGFEFGPRVSLVEPPAGELPDFEAAMSADERATTTSLVNWFGGWAVSRSSCLRRFLVLSMHRKQWKDAWEARMAHLSCYKPSEFVRAETERNTGVQPRKG